MAVAPDLLLQSAPEVKPRKAAARPPAETPQPRKNESSSFAQVYAKERQTSPKPKVRRPQPRRSRELRPPRLPIAAMTCRLTPRLQHQTRRL